MRGFGILEIVIAVALIAMSLFALTAVAQIAYRAVGESSNIIRAGFLAEEGFEALKTIRDDNWNNISSLTLDQTYYLVFSAGKWQTTATPQVIDGLFTRSFVLREAFRDTDDDIASSGTSDPNTKKVEMKISWSERGANKELNATTYLTNLFLE